MRPFWRSSPPRNLETDAFKNILAEYNAGKKLEPQEIDERVRRLSDDLKDQPPNSAVICETELLRLRICTSEDLMQAIPELRRRWAILSSQPRASSALDRADHAKLLAEASFLTVQIMRQHDLRETFESIKATNLRRAIIPLLVAFPVTLALSLLHRDPTVFVVMLVGACGGFVSFCQRVYKMDPGRDLVEACKQLRSERSSVIAKPVLGGAFALALYLLFISKMVTGTLFPSPQVVGATEAMHFNDFLTGVIQCSPGDFAKLLVWSFIAGFAERFVPDILNRLAKSPTHAASSSSH